VYRHLSGAEHGWHYFRQQLDTSREVFDERTHAIIHLKHHVEQQDLKLKDRAAIIADLEQQLQVPPAPTVSDTVLDVDEE
jgi:hypothetical protein